MLNSINSINTNLIIFDRKLLNNTFGIMPVWRSNRNLRGIGGIKRMYLRSQKDDLAYHSIPINERITLSISRKMIDMSELSKNLRVHSKSYSDLELPKPKLDPNLEVEIDEFSSATECISEDDRFGYFTFSIWQIPYFLFRGIVDEDIECFYWTRNPNNIYCVHSKRCEKRLETIFRLYFELTRCKPT